MAQRTSVQLTNEQLEAADDLDGRGVADNRSEAIRMFVNAGMREYGYENGERKEESRLAGACRMTGYLFATIAMTWAATSYLWPVEIRMPALAFAFAAIVAFGFERAVEQYDGVGVARLFGRGEKA